MRNQKPEKKIGKNIFFWSSQVSILSFEDRKLEKQMNFDLISVQRNSIKSLFSCKDNALKFPLEQTYVTH